MTFSDQDTLASYGKKVWQLIKYLFRRKEPIVAIGGGVCLDVAGLTANLYRRNTPVIKVCIKLLLLLSVIDFHLKSYSICNLSSCSKKAQRDQTYSSCLVLALVAPDTMTACDVLVLLRPWLFAMMQIPTTVMAAIDASIGIKTAVNFNNRKNKMGTYCSPLAVFIDRWMAGNLPISLAAIISACALGHSWTWQWKWLGLTCVWSHLQPLRQIKSEKKQLLIGCVCRSFLQTLDQRNLSNGAAEMLKMACVKDAELFHMLENHGHSFVEGKFQVSLCFYIQHHSMPWSQDWRHLIKDLILHRKVHLS